MPPAEVFNFRELAMATENFSSERLLGHGGFGRVYTGCLQKTNQMVAVKQLDNNRVQEDKEFLVEVVTLSLLRHPNLVDLIGYCADGRQRILVYEYMYNGTLEHNLFDLPQNKTRLDWYTRMRIAKGAAEGLEYLHDIANPPVVFQDFRPSNILLDERYNAKLSDFEITKLDPTGEHVNNRIRLMGTNGYCAPEYDVTGELTTKSDVYSFGVVFLEIISGRRAIDHTKPTEEENLVAWAKQLFHDRSKFELMVDSSLRGKYPEKGLYQAIAIAAMCLQEEASTRPLIRDVVTTLESLTIVSYEESNEMDM